MDFEVSGPFKAAVSIKWYLSQVALSRLLSQASGFWAKWLFQGCCLNQVVFECIEQTKLLGIYLTPDLKWQANTRQIYLKAMSRMWLLRRLKFIKLEPEVLMDYYIKEIRPLTEHGVAIWNSGLTHAQINEIEKIQKVALKIILDENYITYEVACTLMNTQPLKHRRTELHLLI